jgi:hypothetical protein
MERKIVYIIYDERAYDGNTDDASVMMVDSETPLREILVYRKKEYPNSPLYAYDVAKDGKTLINERLVV